MLLLILLVGFLRLQQKEGSSAYEAEQVAEAKAILKPFILRRTKEDVELDLPGKTNHVEFVRMNYRQEELYKNMISRYSKEKRDLSDRVTRLEHENAALKSRLDAATARTKQMLDRVRFIRQQAQGGGER